MNFPINIIYYIAIITFTIVLSYYLLAGENKFPKLWGGKRGYESKLDKFEFNRNLDKCLENIKNCCSFLILKIPRL